MARSLQRKNSGTTSSLVERRKVNANCRQNVGGSSNQLTKVQTSEMQELQDIIDIHNEKLNVVKLNYSKQNVQLAKTNSVLMIKINDMEKKFSELVQENVMLRSKDALNKSFYTKQLDEQIQLLQTGVIQKFEDILYMFDSVRKSSGLPARKIIHELLPVKENLDSKKRTLSPSIHFNDNTNAVELYETKDQIQLQGQKRRRKSSRRRSSFVIPEDMELLTTSKDTIDEQVSETNAKKIDTIDEDSNLEKNAKDSDTIMSSPKQTSPLLEIENSTENSTTIPEDKQITIESSANFTNSIIDYSIPEETPELSYAVSTDRSLLDSSSQRKIEVFKDEVVLPNTSEENVGQLSSNKEQITTDTMSLQLHSQNKIKHSFKAPRSRINRKIVDEVMPSSNTVAEDVTGTRFRRTRGKTVDYKLPSLRAKMRRPSEKFVDATTITNIQDLQVKYPGKHSRKINSLNEPETKLENFATNTSSFTSNTNNDSFTVVCNTLQHDKETDIQNDETQLSNTSTPTIKRKSSTSCSNNHLPTKLIDTKLQQALKEGSMDLKKPALKDVTNTKNCRPLKTKKLFKKAIINNINDENSDCFNESVTSGSSSFRLNEDDLLVFDFIGTNKLKSNPKTYRINAKKYST